MDLQTPPNPYAPPRTPGPRPHTPIDQHHLNAIFVGASVANGLAYVVMQVPPYIYFWLLRWQGVPLEALFMRAAQSVPLLLLVHALGILSCMPGGYWAARLGAGSPLKCAGFSACAVSSVAVLLMTCLPYPNPVPVWSQIASVLTPFPGCWLGALWWCGKQAAQERRNPQQTAAVGRTR
ncbi:MAG: hypothetical protein ABWX87_02065 [Pseudoxanthomonas sp.]